MTPAGRWLEESLLTEGGRQALAELSSVKIPEGY